MIFGNNKGYHPCTLPADLMNNVFCPPIQFSAHNTKCCHHIKFYMNFEMMMDLPYDPQALVVTPFAVDAS